VVAQIAKGNRADDGTKEAGGLGVQSERKVGFPGGLVFGGLVLLVMVQPLAMGSVAGWAQSAVFCAAAALAALCLLRGAWVGSVRVAKTWAWLFVALFVGLALFQLVPLGRGAAAAISPATVETCDSVLEGGSPSRVSISLFPYGTLQTLIRFGGAILIFFLVMHLVTTRRRAAALVAALAALAVFEVLYGFWQQFSGRQQIFWIRRAAHLSAVTGTFVNKNHFAGLIEMILPASLGLMLGIMPRRSGRISRGRAGELLSSREVHLPALLLGASALMAMGVCFSLSRAGIVCAIGSLVGLGICMGLSANFRKYTILLLLLVTAILVVAVGIGGELLVESVEDVAAGRATSWADRVDLWGSGVALFRKFPILGTGLGSFRYVFERFQSARFGARVADYLHNDWLQVFCEMGVAGAVLTVVGLCGLIWRTGRTAIGRRDPFCRWVSIGALLGVGAMLAHSFFDYNLYKITSNASVFAALLGLSYAAAHMPSEGRGSARREGFARVRLGPAVVRVALAAAVVAGGFLLCLRPARAAMADIAFNRFLASTGRMGQNSYFFLPVRNGDRDRLRAGELLAGARRLDPLNPEYRYYTAASLVEQCEAMVKREAEEAAQRILKMRAGRASEEAAERVSAALAGEIRLRPSPERARLLRKAQAELGGAIRRLPVAAQYHVSMAQILAGLARAEGNREEARRAMAFAKRAVWLAPLKPDILYRAGRVILEQSHAVEQGKERGEGVRDAQACFRRAMYADPSYSARVYPLVSDALGKNDALLAVTPRTIRAYEYLAEVLWKEGAWNAFLHALDSMESLVNLRESGGRPKQLAPGGDPRAGTQRGSVGYDVRAPLAIRLSIEKRRCAVLGILGRWNERERSAASYKALLRRSLSGEVAEARRLLAGRRYEEALRTCREILRRDWGNPDALLAAAEAARAEGRSSVAPLWEGPLDFLHRLVIYNERLSSEELRHVRDVVGRMSRMSDEERVEADFLVSAASVLAGKESDGIEGLAKLGARTDEAAVSWRQRHLIWYYLGLGREMKGDKEGAISAYRRVIEIVPTHRLSLLRLAALGVDVSPSLAALTPGTPCNVNFGGKVTLLGYALGRGKVPLKVGGVALQQDAWLMTYYWEFHDRAYRDYHPAVHFCDGNWRVLFQNDHRIRADGEIYPMDFPRCGEVVVARERLAGDPEDAVYLRIAVLSAASPRGLGRFLLQDGGDWFMSLVHGRDKGM